MKKAVKTAIGITAGVAAGTVGTVVLAPAVLGLVGFGTAGISAGSIAASMMSSAAIANGGGVAAGSLVAVLQSVGAAGFSAATTAGVASTGGVIGGIVGWFSGRKDKGQPPNTPTNKKPPGNETGNSSPPEDEEENEGLSNDPSPKELQKFLDKQVKEKLSAVAGLPADVTMPNDEQTSSGIAIVSSDTETVSNVANDIKNPARGCGAYNV
ncbi:hypothetical protein KOW79_002880 [Hemibagrus wyckioides]|uniref:Uncharacterized protein n=1 Tax=Hemibagrus wyckioides TaxID=337641 RepID=A0A9D3SX85_9TELE|nr:hypothetical protein KOW79_002880 [Hemibagrus wyckioides]